MKDSNTFEIVMYVIGAVMAVFNVMACIICKLLWGMFQELKSKIEEFVKDAPKTFLTTEAYDRRTSLTEKEDAARDTKISELYKKAEDRHVAVSKVDVEQNHIEKRVDRLENKIFSDK